MTFRILIFEIDFALPLTVNIKWQELAQTFVHMKRRKSMQLWWIESDQELFEIKVLVSLKDFQRMVSESIR